MLPSSSEIENFIEVASTLNISRAAERLGITQPTLSLSIQRLEHLMGTTLLLRSKTGVKLTKAGSRFAQTAKELLDIWGTLRAETLSEENEIKGRVSIGCHVSVALYSVSHFVGDLVKEHPDLEISLMHDLSRKITEKIISFELDCGIVVNPVAHPDLRIVQLCKDEVTFWKGPGTCADDVLIYDPSILQSQALISKLKKMNREIGGFRRHIHSSSLEVVAKLAAHGAGVAILPTRVALAEESYRLRHFGSRPPVFEDKICFVYRPDAQKRKAFKVVVDKVEKFFQTTK